MANIRKYEKIKTKYANNRCATHPHNIYIEVLSETGLAGMLLLVSINLYIFVYFLTSLKPIWLCFCVKDIPFISCLEILFVMLLCIFAKLS